MLEFEWPLIFLLLPLPLLAYWLLPCARQQQAAVRVPFYAELSSLQEHNAKRSQGGPPKVVFLSLLWLCLLTAAAAPSWIGDAITLPSEGRDLMLAVDLSGSMQREDMQIKGRNVDRLTAVKAVLSEFIEQRKGDRLGLILFADNAYVQAPLTFDRKTVQRFMDEAQIGFAGEKTAIGDAIGLAVKRLRERPGDNHVLVLLTDGTNNAGEVKPIAAAKVAAENGIKIYTVAVGSDEMQRGGFFGRSINPSADLDERPLKEIADITGGQFFRARDPAQLMSIYQHLDQLEPIEDEQLTFRPQKALFYWPLSAALLLSVLFALGRLHWQSIAGAFTTGYGAGNAKPAQPARKNPADLANKRGLNS